MQEGVKTVGLRRDDIRVLLVMLNCEGDITTTRVAKELLNTNDVHELRKMDIKVRRILRKLERMGILESETIMNGKMKKQIYKIKEDAIGIGQIEAKITLPNGEEMIRIDDTLALKIDGRWIFVNIEKI